MDLQVLNTVWDRGGVAVGLLAECSGVLILLAAAFLVFRTFRERYLLAWILGWSFYLVYRVSTVSISIFSHPQWLFAVAQGAFVCAITLFVLAILYYTGALKFRVLLAAVGIAAASLAVARALWWPSTVAGVSVVRGACLLMAIGGAVQLAVFSRGRRQVGPWVLIAMLLLLHMDLDTNGPHFLAGIDMVIELLLGLSMLMMVLDDSKQRTDRLGAINLISSAIAGAQEHESMVLTALEQLKRLTGARATWFRLLEGNAMVLIGHVGLSEKFIAERSSLDVRSADGARIVQQGEPVIIRTGVLEEDNQRLVREEGFDHILLVPVKGKTSVIGSIAIGQSRSRSYPTDELKFLTAAAHQVGIAVENMRLLEEIIHSHQQWISTFDSIEDMVLVHDAEFRILKLNRAVVKRLGVAIAELVFQPCEKVLPEAATKWNHCPYCEQGRANFAEGPDPCFGGHSLVSTSSFTEAGVYQGTIHVVRDTTERRAAEERYRLLFEQVQEGVFVSTPEGRIVECNDAFVNMLGYGTREEVLALDISRDMYISATQRQSFCAVMNQSGFVRNYEVDLRRKDGTILHALENSFATRDASGKIEQFQGFLLDITEKRRAEDEIRHRNRELHALNSIAVIASRSFDLDEILNTALRHLADIFAAPISGVYLIDKHDVLQRRAAYGQRNPAQYARVTLPPEFLQRIRQLRIEVFTHEDAEQLPEILGEYVRSEGLRCWIWVVMWNNDSAVGVLGIGSREERKFKPTDQHLMVAIARQLANTIEKVRLYEETCRAYDNLRDTQEQLLQSEKMNAIGQLISGVAHEMNNPLTAILGYSQLLENEPIGERAQDFVHKLFKQAQRTQRLVQNLLSFARQRKPEKKEVNIRQVVDDTLALRDFDFHRRNITVKCEVEPGLPAVIADAHQMEQVFLNIINNAVDAMLEVDNGGTLWVRSYHHEGRVCVEIRDSGPGIREPKKVFDPFYTTKSVGKGTGLGLSICYGILKEHGGDIIALNHPDGGALFRVMLPACANVPAEVPVEKPAHLPPLNGRVLLVDDEEAVLEFEREALSGAGAQVVAVTSGEQAIEQLREERFDVMLVDPAMPGNWSGMELYRWVADNFPGAEQNIIFTVSNIREEESGSVLNQGQVTCIVKPFQVAELIAATRTLLTRASKAAAAT
ncbi:MAG: GAF domain-containing protein [Terriglobales bacterium]